MMPQGGAGPAWDRTRWDRLQASLLVAGIAVLSSAPSALLLAALGGAL